MSLHLCHGLCAQPAGPRRASSAASAAPANAATFLPKPSTSSGRSAAAHTKMRRQVVTAPGPRRRAAPGSKSGCGRLPYRHHAANSSHRLRECRAKPLPWQNLPTEVKLEFSNEFRAQWSTCPGGALAGRTVGCEIPGSCTMLRRSISVWKPRPEKRLADGGTVYVPIFAISTGVGCRVIEVVYERV